MKIDERAAQAKYRVAARAAKSKAIRDIFENLVYEEEVHINTLERFERDLKKLLAAEKSAKL
jgi:rubrerythrin